MAGVFGTWKDWTWPSELTGERAGDEVNECEEHGFADGPHWDFMFRVDVESFEKYVAEGKDSRPQQVAEYMRLISSHVERDECGMFMRHRGVQKVVAGQPLGRYYFPALSPPNLSRAARAALFPAGSYEFDQPTAVVHFMLERAEELGVCACLLEKYKTHKAQWREAVQRYFDLPSLADAKALLQKATFGFAHPLDGKDALGVLPILEGLAYESFTLRKALCQQNAAVLEAAVAAGKRRPETSTMAMLLFDDEAKVTRDFCNCLQAFKWLPAAPVYDAVAAAPLAGGEAISAIVESFAAQSNVRMEVTELRMAGRQPQAGTLSQVLESLLNGAERLEDCMVVAGAQKCLAFSLANIFRAEDETLAASFGCGDGPLSFRQCMELHPGLSLEPVSVASAAAGDGSHYIAHETRPGREVGHAIGVLCYAGKCRVHSDSVMQAVEIDAATFWRSVAALPRAHVFEAKLLSASLSLRKRKLANPLLDMLSGAEAPDVAERVLDTVAEKVRAETHLTKYHVQTRLFTANTRTEAQWNTVQALYEQDQILAPLQQPRHSESLLRDSADLIRKWVSPDEDSQVFLQKQNDVDLVLLLTGEGPRYVLKQQTSHCKRLNQNVYYDSTAAAMLLGLVLKHQGRAQASFQDLVSAFIAKGSPCAFLGLRRQSTQQQLLDEIFSSDAVQTLRGQLLAEATQHGEWQVLSHDATFKSLFSIIGQVPMSQKPNEAHALHSILGKSGALPGLSAQASEGLACFERACKAILPPEARATTEWIFSDSPAAIDHVRELFPNLQGMAEDGLHLALRVEACFGEKRTALSREIIALQRKFMVPASGRIHRGELPAAGEEGKWPAKADNMKARGREWNAYVQEPYASHQDYIDDLASVTVRFATDMGRKDSKGRTVFQILQSGAAYQHYAYLLNGSRATAALSLQDRQMLSWGTTANEAVHFQFNRSQQTVTQQHVDSSTLKLEAAELISSMVGYIMSGEFAGAAGVAMAPVTSRQELRRPVHFLDKAKVARMRAFATTRKSAWVKEAARREEMARKRGCERAQQKVKRTVFTKQKQRKLRQRRKPAQTQEVSLRGLHVQWPFSQLLLAGYKTQEVRGYALGHLNIAHANEEMWLVETRGGASTASYSACIPEGFHVPPRPKGAQIVGTIRFSEAVKLIDGISFAAARAAHCVRQGSKFDWCGTPVFAWKVAAVRSLAYTVAAPEGRSQVGYAKPVKVQVAFR
ncbi:unnamed protein product [Effrenium voratum]|uniref:Uncharacterized protein n=1 Tax=Effrenium voratum TaxID=2562239 RepID=A0AA36I9X4_9DINO|nr:unnamed protein product [Effrenium voratum]